MKNDPRKARIVYVLILAEFLTFIFSAFLFMEQRLARSRCFVAFCF